MWSMSWGVIINCCLSKSEISMMKRLELWWENVIVIFPFSVERHMIFQVSLFCCNIDNDYCLFSILLFVIVSFIYLFIYCFNHPCPLQVNQPPHSYFLFMVKLGFSFFAHSHSYAQMQWSVFKYTLHSLWYLCNVDESVLQHFIFMLHLIQHNLQFGKIT